MTFLGLLKKIQSDGPIEILGEKAMVIKPDIFDYIVIEFEKLLAAQEKLLAAKEKPLTNA